MDQATLIADEFLAWQHKILFIQKVEQCLRSYEKSQNMKVCLKKEN
jgi:hypothetical protein